MDRDDLRVLLTAPDLELMGGVAETVRLLLRELDGHSHACYRPFGRRKGQRGFLRYAMPFLDLFNFAVLLCRKRFDVIHMNPSLNARSVFKELLLFTVFCLFGYSGRILVFLHGWEQDLFDRIAARTVTVSLLRMVMKRAGTVLVLAGSFRDSLVRVGVDADKVHIVTTMVDMSELPPVPSSAKECRTLLYLSRIIREKGVYEIMDAFTSLSTRHEGLTLIMAGDGPERARLEEIATSRGLKNVIFSGFIRGREKYEVLEKSCIFLLPTRYGEGCPVALLEAMGSGLVPIVADAGGIMDVVIPGETALLLDEISGESIELAVERILSDESKRKQISGNAASYAEKHLSSAQVTRFITNCYFKMCVESAINN
ncbi:glycosyltransferase family 4 protein [Maridesulfovibrio sp. FT414]|uniref:glycosyltransferase family 4 protein n=1 Tax=Maridesulfovibrio sp. FT414 TaxID=2979469 RepID=UPI003D806B6E